MGTDVKAAKCFSHARNFERVFEDWENIVHPFLNFTENKWNFIYRFNSIFAVLFGLMVVITMIVNFDMGFGKKADKVEEGNDKAQVTGQPEAEEKEKIEEESEESEKEKIKEESEETEKEKIKEKTKEEKELEKK